MQLSIVMMVKNESKYLDQCLKSLNSIRSQIEAELIVLDTGSTDNTVNIAKKYTKKVFLKEWNGNFSDMRNTSISYAKGQWVFILDGDEVVDNPTDLIDFFKTNSYSKYNTATVRIENIYAGKISSIMAQCRLFKRDSDFKYNGAIHEQPSAKKPLKNLNTNIIHYGYDMTDIQLKERKYKRNTEILFKELKNNPDNYYYWFQLGQSYCAYDEYQKGLDAILTAIDVMKKAKIEKSKMMFIFIYHMKIYFFMERYDDVIAIANEALSISKEYLDVYYYMGKAQQLQHKYQDAVKSFDRYLDMVFCYHKFKGYHDITTETASVNSYENIYANMCLLHNKLSNYKRTIEYGCKLKQKEVLTGALKAIVEAFVKEKELKELKSFYDKKISGDIELLNIFGASLEKVKIYLDEANKQRLVREYSTGEDNYSLLNKIRLENYKESVTIDDRYVALVNNLDLNELADEYADIIYFLIKRDYSIVELLSETNTKKVEGYFNYLLKQYKKDFIKLAIELTSQLTPSEMKLCELRVYKPLAKVLALSDNLDLQQLKEIIQLYSEMSFKYISNTINSQVIENEMIYDVQDNETAFIILIYHANKHKSTNKLKYVKYLRRALKTMPNMGPIIEFLLKEIEEEKTNPYNQLKKEAEGVKERIKLLLEEGNIEAAYHVIGEYEKIVNNDADIFSFKIIMDLMSNNLEAAQQHLNMGLSLDENNCDLLYNGGYIMALSKNYEKAVEYYSRALTLTDDEELKKEIELAIQDIKSISSSNSIVKESPPSVELNINNQHEEQSLLLKNSIKSLNDENEDIHMKKPAVSILTWAYNSEKYIVQCAESVLNQSFSDFEWIVLDNGSTDGTSEMLAKYQKKDKRVKVFRNELNCFIHKKQNNPDYTKYIDSLESEYVCHLDSDDYLHKDFLRELYFSATKKNADIAVGGTEMFSEESGQTLGLRCPPSLYVSPIQKLGERLPDFYGSFRPLWGKLVRTTIHLKARDHVNQRKIKLLNGGDTMISLVHLKYASSLISIHKALHYYRIRSGSHYNSQIDTKRYQDYLLIYEESKNLLTSWNQYSNSNQSFILSVLFYSIKDLIDLTVNSTNVTLESKIPVVTNILADKRLREVFNNKGALIKLLDYSINSINHMVNSNH
ncbi:glycosyltransferase [Alkaliphilus pronyensis]|uniref:Glycosyltransferase n=1 Tax=Alkaliphilus pronyensis TaxID=1482732 RepID=A0A6I0FLV0_9FIRM|nr:glycosyltransferase [Alkaliphilus pronyensis]KAB3539669.1 glycosyltransferase [Alkaliphilus pronyensis]